MIMRPKLSDYLIIHISQSNTLDYLDSIQGINLLRKKYHEDFNDLLKNNLNVIIIISVKGLNTIAENIIVSTKFSFNHIPIIVHLDVLNVDDIRKCGEMGVDNVIIEGINVKSLKNNMEKLINEKVSIKIYDFGINSHVYSNLVKNALELIEDNYLRLMNVKEIADILNVSDCTLISEFKKNGLLSPKKLLLHFKVKHSLMLMQNVGLNLKEIASLSGFSDEKRFIECFHRFFQKSPGNVRKNISSEFIKKFAYEEVS